MLTPCSGRTKLSAELSEEAKRVVGGGSGFAAPEGSLRVLGEKKEEKERKEKREERRERNVRDARSENLTSIG